MATLFDILQEQMAGSEPTAAPQLGQGEQVAGLLRTKLTGQAPVVSTETPKRSMIGEQAAAQQTQAAIGQVEQQAQLAAEQQAQQAADQMQQAEAKKQQDLQERQLKQEYFGNQANAALMDFKRQGKKVQTARDVAQMEQAATMARLANDKYIMDLELAAARARLQDESNFKDAYYKQVFGDSEALLQSGLDFKRLQSEDARAWTAELSKISLDDAVAMARSNMQAEQERQKWAAGVGIFQGGLQGINAYSAGQSAKAADTIAAQKEAREKALFDKQMGVK